MSLQLLGVPIEQIDKKLRGRKLDNFKFSHEVLAHGIINHLSILLRKNLYLVEYIEPLH